MMIVIAANACARIVGAMNEQADTTGQRDNHRESTYALLVGSEEKSRNVLELAIYPLLILGPLIAIWQLAQRPITIPAAGLDAGCVVCVDEIQTLPEVRHSEVKG
jgi:hypothetical protein